MLNEETITLCFQVNDELCKILEDVEHPEKRPVCAATSSSAVGAGVSTSAGTTGAENTSLETLDFDAFGFEDRRKAVAGDGNIDTDSAVKPATSKIASSALEDLLAPPSSPSATLSTSVSNDMTEDKQKKKSADNDDGKFDDFFGARQVSNNSFSIDE